MTLFKNLKLSRNDENPSKTVNCQGKSIEASYYDIIKLN